MWIACHRSRCGCGTATWSTKAGRRSHLNLCSCRRCGCSGTLLGLAGGHWPEPNRNPPRRRHRRRIVLCVLCDIAAGSLLRSVRSRRHHSGLPRSGCGLVRDLKTLQQVKVELLTRRPTRPTKRWSSSAHCRSCCARCPTRRCIQRRCHIRGLMPASRGLTPASRGLKPGAVEEVEQRVQLDCTADGLGVAARKRHRLSCSTNAASNTRTHCTASIRRICYGGRSC